MFTSFLRLPTTSPSDDQQYYLPSPPSILISSQISRTASQNLQIALEQLHDTIIKAGRSVIVGETSQGQKEKVKGLERAEKARRRGEKDRRSAKKSSRKDMG
jgi:peptidyl-tRNA hydrolase ICT1